MNRYICNLSIITNDGPKTESITIFGRNIKEAKIVLNRVIQYGWNGAIAYNSLKLKTKNVETHGEDYFQKQLDILEMWKEKKQCIEK